MLKLEMAKSCLPESEGNGFEFICRSQREHGFETIVLIFRTTKQFISLINAMEFIHLLQYLSWSLYEILRKARYGSTHL